MEKSKVINSDIKKLEENFSSDGELENLLLQIPNIPNSDVIVGKDEENNQEVEKWGELPQFNLISLLSNILKSVKL